MGVVDGEEEEVGEEVTAVVAVGVELAVPVGGFGEPEFEGLVFEMDGAVFDELVIAGELDFGDGLEDVGFDGESASLHARPRRATGAERLPTR